MWNYSNVFIRTFLSGRREKSESKSGKWMDNSVLERSPSDQRLTMSVRVSLMPLCWGPKATVSKPLRILFSLPFLPRFHLSLYIYILNGRVPLPLSLSLLVFYFLLLRETFQRRTHPLKCALGHLKRIP